LNLRRLAIVLVILAAILGLTLALDKPRTPAGQPAMVSLTPSTRVDFTRAFDAATGSTRLVFLVSPT